MNIPQGKVLIDDVELWNDHGDKNPTAFRDDLVRTLKRDRMGVLRFLQNAQMGGAPVSVLQRGVKTIRSTNDPTKPVGPWSRRPLRTWSLSEHFELCKEVGAESWYVLPGAIYEEEMDILMEFIGGPETTPGGKLRAEQGSSEPWNSQLKQIHIEIGNEAWNSAFSFVAGGYNGPDYWQKLFERAKKSPYYTSNIILHAAGMNYNERMSERILKDTPAADRYAIAPYQIHDLDDKVLAPLKSADGVLDDEKFFYWALAYPFDNCKSKMSKQAAVSKKHSREFSLYEVNWHITGKFAQDAASPMVPVANRFVTSMPAGLGHVNHMLMLLRDFGIRTQNAFCMFGNFYNVRLWGHYLNIEEGRERARPTGICLGMANRAMSGDMVKVKQSGDLPKVSASGKFPGGSSLMELPLIQSFAFKDGKQTGLILMNFDLTSPHAVTVKGSGTNVRSELAAPGRYDDNNEFESGAEPKIKVQESELPDFSGELNLTLPPASMQTIIWEEK